MTLKRAMSTANDALCQRDHPHINWEFPGDIDTTSIHLLAGWAKDLDSWTSAWEADGATIPPNPTTEQEMFDHLKEKMMRQYTAMKDRSPAQTLHFTAELIQATRRYLVDVRMSTMFHHENDYHSWAADTLNNWARPVKGGLEIASWYSTRLARKEGERPENLAWYKPVPPLDPLPRRWEDLGDLRNELIALSTHLATTEQALLPQIADIECMACTGDMFAPKMVNVYSPVESRSPTAFLKIHDEPGCTADLFVRANADFRNDMRLRNRNHGIEQVQWLPLRLSDGHYQINPKLHSVKMPMAAWQTVARVAAILRPHQGRQSNIKDILDTPRWRCDGPWLEMEMEEFFQRAPDTDPARLLVDDVRRGRLLGSGTDPEATSGSSAPPVLLQIQETTGEMIEETTEEAGAMAREWEDRQRMIVDVSREEAGDIIFVAGHAMAHGQR
jgi:hypothetical protein